MGRELMRVPLDFDWPLYVVWEGYCPSIETLHELFDEEQPWLRDVEDECMTVCGKCKEANGRCSERAPYCIFENPANHAKWFRHPPKGDGYQAWETTSEGSPISPVFETLEALCAWLAENATTFGSCRATAGEWAELLTGKQLGVKVLETDSATVYVS